MISIGINLILGLLLTCALIMGVRLERKLRGLRQSHNDFAKAVSELDQAAYRTEASLDALRTGAEDIKGELVSRIDQARIACQRLEKLSADAERAASQPLALSHTLAPPPPARPVERATPPHLAPSPLVQAPLGASAFARPEPEFVRSAAPIQTRPAPVAASPRSRAKMIDDDLFDSGAPIAALRAEPRVAPEPPVHAMQARVAHAVMAPAPRMVAPEPVVEAPRPADRFAREAFYREMLERDARERELIQDNFAPNNFASEALADEPSFSEPTNRDPFESGRFANERRAMLAAVMGGRR
jgi:hypothetical protein